jgi:DNA-binding MarR family transcriptional regulator
MARANTIPATGTLPPDLAYRLPNPAQPRRGDAEKLETLRDALIDGVRGEMGPDLTQRQLALLLILVTKPEGHHVRDLSARMQVGKPAITRAMDRLESLQFATREPARDRRDVQCVALPAGRFAALALARRLAG